MRRYYEVPSDGLGATVRQLKGSVSLMKEKEPSFFQQKVEEKNNHIP